MVEIAGYRVGAVELARVPYFDVALDPGVVHLTAAEIGAIEWATPYWATADHQVLIGQALWVIVSEDLLIVVDPCLAADPFLRSGPEAIGHQEAALAALRDAGFPPERVDVVVLSHLDGIGMTAVVTPDGGWAPAFPNARVVMTAAELEWLTGGSENAAMTGGFAALTALIDQGVVDGVQGGHAITSEVRLDLTGAHSAGHAFVRIESGGERATFLGHLALSPLNIATRDCSVANEFVALEAKALDRLVSEAAADDTLIIGPLWPFPGAVYATGDRVVTAAD